MNEVIREKERKKQKDWTNEWTKEAGRRAKIQENKKQARQVRKGTKLYSLIKKGRQENKIEKKEIIRRKELMNTSTEQKNKQLLRQAHQVYQHNKIYKQILKIVFWVTYWLNPNVSVCVSDCSSLYLSFFNSGVCVCRIREVK